MTQPAKVQEPSMEEILASIRRIIADDEAKPATADKPAAVEKAATAAPPPKVEPPPQAKPAVKNPPPAPPSAAKVAMPSPKPAPAAPAASNSQDDIDSLLASLDEATPPSEIRPPQPDGDVFELTDEMALPDPTPAPEAAASFHKVEPQDDVEFAEASTRMRPPAHEPPPIDTPFMQPILSGTTMRAVESAFNSLANTVLSNNARTLEDLVKEMLRPMLKAWLDDNLPGLVERIVKAEIERVSRGR
ncbi:PopZ family protein [Bradyrhizobium sp. ORS 111]|uniref:PopZ family protein n=1 Tax=Bradyrhizobium sp. ORS 111 TaxID=1685958 RepID=UPI00388D4E06